MKEKKKNTGNLLMQEEQDKEGRKMNNILYLYVSFVFNLAN